MIQRTTNATVLALAALMPLGLALWGGCVPADAKQQQEPHNEAECDGHDHEGEADDAHAGEAVDAHVGEDDHAGETVIQLDEHEREELGIEIATAGPGTMETFISLPGEVVLNDDRLAHIFPRAPGIVREVLKQVGDPVSTGEVMAWLESSEFGEARVNYMAQRAELDCCSMDFTRARDVHDNTNRLLAQLTSSPSLESLREETQVAMGVNRGTLISAYAELILAKTAYEREKPLLEKKVASQQDYQAAESRYRKAEALYVATRDTVGYAVSRDFFEARRAQRMREIQVRSAERRLYVLGLTAEDIQSLDQLAKSRNDASHEEGGCDDPNCEGCARDKGMTYAPDSSARKLEEKLAWYPLRAPFDGTVIARHLTLGEKHGDDSNAFTVADLSSVWMDIRVYQRDMGSIRKGQHVHLDIGTSDAHADGVISYVAPLVDEKTRTALARVVVSNDDGVWRPGLFITAKVAVGTEDASVVIPKSAVQRLDNEPVVFLETPEGLESAPVRLGHSDDTHVEIVAGLHAGQRYVTKGAFELKAKLVTSGLDPHAGHGH